MEKENAKTRELMQSALQEVILARLEAKQRRLLKKGIVKSMKTLIAEKLVYYEQKKNRPQKRLDWY